MSLPPRMQEREGAVEKGPCISVPASREENLNPKRESEGFRGRGQQAAPMGPVEKRKSFVGSQPRTGQASPEVDANSTEGR